MRDFLERLENGNPTDLSFPTNKRIQKKWDKYADEAAIIAANSIKRQFIYPNEEDATVLRVSQLGKPAVELAARHFYPDRLCRNHVIEKVKRTFFIGDLFEAYVLFTLKRLGYIVESYQPEIVWYGLPGHPDAVVIDPQTDERFVVDFKTANDRYFKSVQRYGVDDERGYLTQISCYAEATEAIPCFLFFNKNTSELTASFPNSRDIRESTKRARKLVDCLRKCTEFDDVYKYLKAPAPVPEMRNKLATGNFLLPYEMTYSKYIDLFYVMDESGKYVLDYRYPEKWMRLKPKLIA